MALIYLDLSNPGGLIYTVGKSVKQIERGVKDFHYLECSCSKEQKWSPCVVQLSFYHIYLIQPL